MANNAGKTLVAKVSGQHAPGQVIWFALNLNQGAIWQTTT